MSSARRTPPTLVAAVMAASALVLLPPSHAHAQTVPGHEVARQLFEEGAQLENQKSYAQALEKFREAEQIRATPALRFHKGFCLENLGKVAAALDEYEAAERSAREQNKAETLRTARERLQALRPRVPQLAVKLVAPPNAEVLLDGVAIAAPLLANGTKFRVEPGEHQLVARAPEYVTRTQKISLLEAASSQVEISLQRAPSAAVPVKPAEPPPPETKPVETKPAETKPAETKPAEPPPASEVPAPEAGPKRSLALPIATTAGAVALVAGGVAAFLVAGNKASDASTLCRTKLSCDDERSSVRTFDTLALAGFVSGAALGGLSVVLWVRKPKADAAQTTKPRLRIGPSGVFVEGTL